MSFLERLRERELQRGKSLPARTSPEPEVARAQPGSDTGVPVQWVNPQWLSAIRQVQRERGPGHIFVGYSPLTLNHRTLEALHPVTLPVAAFTEHVYFTGGSGSGKTTLGVLPFLAQLILGSFPDRPAIVVCDLKGDLAMYHTLRHLAGDSFQPFILEDLCESDSWNPLREEAMRELRDEVLIQKLLLALDCDHGPQYPAGYWTSRNRDLFNLVAQRDSKSLRQSFKAIANTLANRIKHDSDVYRNALQLVSAIVDLSRVDHLNETRANDVSLRRIVEQGGVAYFFLPSLESPQTARFVGNLVLQTLLQTARRHATRQCYVVVDEFQRLAGCSWQLIMEQCRAAGAGVSMWLANQSLASLLTREIDLRPTVDENTRLQFYFTIRHADQARDLESRFGEKYGELLSESNSRSTTQTLSNDWKEARSNQGNRSDVRGWRSRLPQEDLLAISSHPQGCLLDPGRDADGVSFGGEPVTLQMEHMLTREQYDVWRRTPLPRRRVVSDITPG
jgi:type IV secretory pathway TraG/TraD family ATPase VirD4